MTITNYSTAVFFIDERVRAIKAIYEKDTERTQAPREIFKTLDQNLKKGDYIIVPTDSRHNMSVLEVVEVDVRLDLLSTANVKWVIGKINLDDYKKITAWEDGAIAKMQNAEAAKKRKELAATMGEYFEGIEPLKLEDNVQQKGE